MTGEHPSCNGMGATIAIPKAAGGRAGPAKRSHFTGSSGFKKPKQGQMPNHWIWGSHGVAFSLVILGVVEE